MRTQEDRFAARGQLRPEVQIFPIEENSALKGGLLFDPLYLVSENFYRLSPDEYLFLTLPKGFSDPIQENSNIFSSLQEKISALGYVNNDAFAHLKEMRESDYVQRKIRPMHHVGTSYPADYDQAKRLLPSEKIVAEATDTSVFLIPHIDFRLDTEVYKKAFASFSQLAPPLIVMLGTSHYPHSSSWVYPSSKPFQTPFGVLCADTERINKLRQTLGISEEMAELPHRIEHSLEYHAFWLKGTMPDAPPVMPILIAPFEEAIAQSCLPETITNIREGFDVLSAFLASLPQDTLYVVSGDMAHKGRRFGEGDFSFESIDKQKERDIHLLRYFAAGDKEAMYEVLLKHSQNDKICSFSPLYTLLACLPYRISGSLQEYKFTYFDVDASFISYATIEYSRR